MGGFITPQYRRAYNTDAITLTGVSNGDVYTVKYGNYTGTFTITDDIETNDLCKYGIAVLSKTPTFAIEELKRTQDRLSDMQNPR